MGESPWGFESLRPHDSALVRGRAVVLRASGERLTLAQEQTVQTRYLILAALFTALAIVIAAAVWFGSL